MPQTHGLSQVMGYQRYGLGQSRLYSQRAADSNAAQPALASHRVSIALAQARRAAEAQITPSTTVDHDHSPEQQDEDQSDGLSLPPITPTTASRASTIPPTDPDIEDSVLRGINYLLMMMICMITRTKARFDVSTGCKATASA